MSSSNLTPNYNLPQYSANDKPTYLGDFNNAMSVIDTALKSNADNIETVTATANNASETSAIAKTTAENANTKADKNTTDIISVQETANSALTKANSANTIANNATAQATQNANDIGTINNEIQTLNQKTTENILFESSTGSISNITLNDNIQNYKCIDIIFGTADFNYTTTARFYLPINKYFTFSYKKLGATASVYEYVKTLELVGNNLNIFRKAFIANGSANMDADECFVYKIIGYK